MKKILILTVAVILLTGCGSPTQYIVDKLEPTSLYESYGVHSANLKTRSKCPSPPTVKIVNIETRVEEYPIYEYMSINPKELTDAFVGYLKYGFDKSQIMVDDSSTKVIRISFEDSKIIKAFFRVGGSFKVKVDIPEMKYSEIYEATDYSPISAFIAIAYAMHDVSRKIIDDPRIQDYILCR